MQSVIWEYKKLIIRGARTLRRDFLLAGIILTIIGVVLLFLSIIQVPYTATELIEVPKSDVSLDESFNVAALSHAARATTFGSGRTLHITFSVTAGGNKDIDFKSWMKWITGNTGQMRVIRFTPLVLGPEFLV